MDEFLSIPEIGTRVEQSDRMTRHWVKFLIQEGRLKEGADVLIEEGGHPNRRRYFVRLGRLLEEAEHLTKSRFRGKLMSLVDKSVDTLPTPVDTGNQGKSTTPKNPLDTQSTAVDTGVDTKRPLVDKLSTEADAGKAPEQPSGLWGLVIKGKDELIATLKGENTWKTEQITEKDRQLKAKDEQLKVAGASLLQAQHQIEDLTEDRNHWREQALGLPAGTDRADGSGRAITEMEAEPEKVEATDTEEPRDGSGEPAPEIKDVWAGSGLGLTEEQIVLELFEIWRAVEHAVHNPSPKTKGRLERMRDRLVELANGLADNKWRGHALALKEKAATLA